MSCHARAPGLTTQASREIRATRGRCSTGDAVVTTAGELPARWVVHTVGPIYRDGQSDEPKLLASCYRESLERAREVGARTIAFPSVSTGVYGYPVAAAARVALVAVIDWAREHGDLEEIRFVLFSDEDLAVYRTAIEDLESSS